jgi:hypothetical protein
VDSAEVPARVASRSGADPISPTPAEGSRSQWRPEFGRWQHEAGAHSARPRPADDRAGRMMIRSMSRSRGSSRRYSRQAPGRSRCLRGNAWTRVYFRRGDKRHHRSQTPPPVDTRAGCGDPVRDGVRWCASQPTEHRSAPAPAVRASLLHAGSAARGDGRAARGCDPLYAGTCVAHIQTLRPAAEIVRELARGADE